ncbi:Melanin-concentrating hormone receptor 1 [Larimichthys crocea]|uniref:Melanin-concentrating hormone receptor 1 n=1 Tax=Larimichthys crocea TaxID=215358 RepID=A0A6G0J883_LARCR|nr:Melanin-concentrating hormone receptor 1 [Larimichthys crocea]
MGNCIVIYTIMKKTKCRAKQTVPDIFILNLSIVDLLFLLGMPFLIHQLLGNGTWRFGAAMCTVITALDSNSQIVSTYILTAMTLDRYLATVHPIRCNYIRTPCVATLVIVLVWGLSLLTIIPVWMYAGLMPLPDGLVACALLLPDPVTTPTDPPAHVHQRGTAASAESEGAHQKGDPDGGGHLLGFLHLLGPVLHPPAGPPRGAEAKPAFSYAYNIAISMGYANSCINPFLYIILSETFKRQFLRAVRPVNRKFRVNPSTTDGGSMSVRMVPEGGHQEPACEEMIPSNVAPQ